MNQERDKEIMQQSGKCWHQFEYEPDYEQETYWTCAICGQKTTDCDNHPNPDFTADPVACLEVMMEREDWSAFIQEIGTNAVYGYSTIRIGGVIVHGVEYVRVDLITDRAGKLADLAHKWIKRT